MLARLTIAITLLFAPPANAEPLRVVTSIAPIQGLVADIMEGVGTPTLLLGDAISAHDFAMRPSQAKAISKADVLFYVGQNMEPWLDKALRSLGSNGDSIALGEIPTLNQLKTRELDEIGEPHEDDAPEGSIDPHMWLDPDNALIWLNAISKVLVAIDPDNSENYQANLKRTRNDILATITNIKRELEPLAAIELVVTHDSTQYFENAFGLTVIGAFSASDGQSAGARSLNKLLGKLDPNTCIVEDISHPIRLTASISNDIKHVVIDPMGYDTLDASRSYSRLISELAKSLAGCLP